MTGGLAPCVHGKQLAAACDFCGSTCMHGRLIAGCEVCWGRVRRYPEQVWVTAGGDAFHASSACRWLRYGQDHASVRDLPTYKPQKVTSAKAIKEGRKPCRHCLAGPAAAEKAKEKTGVVVGRGEASAAIRIEPSMVPTPTNWNCNAAEDWPQVAALADRGAYDVPDTAAAAPKGSSQVAPEGLRSMIGRVGCSICGVAATVPCVGSKGRWIHAGRAPSVTETPPLASTIASHVSKQPSTAPAQRSRVRRSPVRSADKLVPQRPVDWELARKIGRVQSYDDS
jgi:hypothetical protein